MPRRLDEDRGSRQLIPAKAGRAPLRGLSCPSSSQDVVARQDERAAARSSVRSCRSKGWGAADPRHWGDVLMAECWNPPTNKNQRGRQRILAVIAAFILAAVLAQAGW